jgi:transposase
MVVASDRSAVDFILSPGNAHDAPQGIFLLKRIQRLQEQKYMLMDRAYEGDEIRSKVEELGFIPIVPPKSNRKNPWEYDRERYKKRNEIERFFLRLKRFRRVFTRYDKLDCVFSGFILWAMIVDAIFV